MGVVVLDGYTNERQINLTVNSDSVDFSGGRLLFHIRRSRREIRLTDAYQKPLLILRRKVVSFRRRWEGFTGKGEEGATPIFSVRKSSVIIGRSGLSAQVYGNPLAGKFRIKRSSENRSFTVYDTRNLSVVAEIRRGVVGAADEGELLLCVAAGFDSTFAAALAIVLDQIGGGLLGL